MDISSVISTLPAWIFFLISVAITCFSFEAGFKIARRRAERSEAEKNAPVAAMAGTTLGLLAFMLAFTFGIAASHFDARKQAVLDDANAIRTTYAMAGLLPQAHQDAVQALLKEYVAIRLKAVGDRHDLNTLFARTEKIHNELWSHAMASDARGAGTSSSWLFTENLDKMIAMHYKRVTTATRVKIPGAIWTTLLLIVVISMSSSGYNAGLAGIRGHLVFFKLAIAFSLVLMLIADLDRPQQSLFKISQQPLEELQRSISAANPVI